MELKTVDIRSIVPGISRRLLNKERLTELANSIRQIGIEDPPLVREVEKGRYQLIDGEHRWRAAQKADLKQIPVLVVSESDKRAKLVSLVVNFLRENYPSTLVEQKVVELWESKEFGTQEELARALGKSQPWVSEQLSVYRYRKENKIPDEVPHETVRWVMHTAPDVREETLRDVRDGKVSSYDARKQITKDKLEAIRVNVKERTSSFNKAEPIRWNWLRHKDIEFQMERKPVGAECPFCHSKELGWLCEHRLSVKEAISELKKLLDSAEAKRG